MISLLTRSTMAIAIIAIAFESAPAETPEAKQQEQQTDQQVQQFGHAECAETCCDEDGCLYAGCGKNGCGRNGFFCDRCRGRVVRGRVVRDGHCRGGLLGRLFGGNPFNWGMGYGHGHGHRHGHGYGAGAGYPHGSNPTGAPLMGVYQMTYPVNPEYFDGRDGNVHAAQGYGVPVGVPLAPVVRQQYNYSWGVPASRVTPISNPAPHLMGGPHSAYGYHGHKHTGPGPHRGAHRGYCPEYRQNAHMHSATPEPAEAAAEQE